MTATRAILLAAAILPLPAAAQARLEDGPRRELRAPGGGPVILWRDARAMEEGMSLLREGAGRADPARLMRAIACHVPSGTPAAIRREGPDAAEVTVAAGQQTGCRGTVPAAMLGPPPRERAR